MADQDVRIRLSYEGQAAVAAAKRDLADVKQSAGDVGGDFARGPGVDFSQRYHAQQVTKGLEQAGARATGAGFGGEPMGLFETARWRAARGYQADTVVTRMMQRQGVSGEDAMTAAQARTDLQHRIAHAMAPVDMARIDYRDALLDDGPMTGARLRKVEDARTKARGALSSMIEQGPSALGATTADVEKRGGILDDEVKSRTKLLDEMDKELDTRKKGRQDEEQEQHRRRSGGGVGQAVGGVMGAGGALLGAAGIGLGIVGILETLGVFKILGMMRPLYEQRDTANARMAGLWGGGGASGVIGAGYGQGYSQAESLQFGEVFGRSRWNSPTAPFGFMRGHSLQPESLAQWGGMAAISGDRETLKLLGQIAKNVSDLGEPLGAVGENLKDYARVAQLGFATQFDPSVKAGRGDWGGLMLYMEKLLGPSMQGRVSNMFTAMQSGITNPSGPGQEALLWRAFGGERGVSYEGVRLQQRVGLMGGVALGDENLAFARQRWGRGTGAEDWTPQGAYKNVVNQIGRESVGDDTRRMELLSGMFPQLSGGELITLFRSMDENGNVSAAGIDQLQKDMKAAQTTQESEGQKIVSNTEATKNAMERAANDIGGKLVPLLQRIERYTAHLLVNILPEINKSILQPLGDWIERTLTPKNLTTAAQTVGRVVKGGVGLAGAGWGAANVAAGVLSLPITGAVSLFELVGQGHTDRVGIGASIEGIKSGARQFYSGFGRVGEAVTGPGGAANNAATQPSPADLNANTDALHDNTRELQKFITKLPAYVDSVEMLNPVKGMPTGRAP